jgi:hypothetical protein
MSFDHDRAFGALRDRATLLCGALAGSLALMAGAGSAAAQEPDGGFPPADSPAVAVPPNLKSVKHVKGHVRASFTLGDRNDPWDGEVAVSPEVGPDGRFLKQNRRISESITASDQSDDNTWQSIDGLPTGTYYVHVSAVSEDCASSRCPQAWSNVLTLVITQRPGKYAGREVNFGEERISFVLANDLRTLRHFTISNIQLDCPNGAVHLTKMVFAPIALRQNKFAVISALRFRGGGGLTVKVEGSLIPSEGAKGVLRPHASLPGAGKCKNFFGAIKWRAHRKG